MFYKSCKISKGLDFGYQNQAQFFLEAVFAAFLLEVTSLVAEILLAGTAVIVEDTLLVENV